MASIIPLDLNIMSELFSKVSLKNCGGDEACLFAITTAIDLYKSGEWDGSQQLIISPSPDQPENVGVSGESFQYAIQKDT